MATDEQTESLFESIMAGDVKAVRRHLKGEVDLNAETPAGGTLLHAAGRNGLSAIALLLIEQGADVDGRDKFGKTSLHCAARVGDLKMAKLLIEHGANVNAQAKNGSHPLDWAVKFEQDEMESLLEECGAKSGKALR